uniref:Uncharacterized protein n=1 Tax=Clytia hemisphaerica TaxID=252671 RepID=A0A7M5XKE4_9CNID|eukprot:TCONS_00020002-protein
MKVKRTSNTTKNSKSKSHEIDIPYDIQNQDRNQSTQLLYTPELPSHQSKLQKDGKNKASNWSLYLDAGRRSLSRASSRTSGLAYYSDDPVKGTDGEVAVFVESGNLTHLHVKQSSLQPIRRENSFNP